MRLYRSWTLFQVTFWLNYGLALTAVATSVNFFRVSPKVAACVPASATYRKMIRSSSAVKRECRPGFDALPRTIVGMERETGPRVGVEFVS